MGSGNKVSLVRQAIFLLLTLLTVASVILTSCASPQQTQSPAATNKEQSGYANPDLLVETGWLAANLSTTDLVILDTRPQKDYDAGHIKGAVNLPTDKTFNPEGPKQMAAPAPLLEKVFSEAGVSNDSRVIIYDDGQQTFAARVLWTLEHFGHRKVAILNGGFKKWSAEQLPVSNEPTKPKAGKFVAKFDPTILGTKESTGAAIGDPKTVILDARSPEEYRGEDVRAKRGGRVPGAVNVDWRQNFNVADGVATYKTPAQLKAMYEAAGVTKDKNVLAYCQTGQRSAVAYFVLRLVGYNATNYDASWQEWGNEADTPIEK